MSMLIYLKVGEVLDSWRARTGLGGTTFAVTREDYVCDEQLVYA